MADDEGEVGAGAGAGDVGGTDTPWERTIEQLRALAEEFREAGAVYTHLQTLDGTHLGSFRHDDPAQFLPGLDDGDGNGIDGTPDAGE